MADREALRGGAAQAIPAETPLRGVIHAAGVLDDGVLAEQDAEQLARVLSPKVKGAWNLHELTAGQGLAFFVMFSSAAGLLGAAGQGNYAAANTFLDAMAAHRRAQGLAAQSLAWGAWSAEMAKLSRHGRGATGRRSRRASPGKGSRALSPAQGVAGRLGQALARPEVQLAVVSLDLRAVARSLGRDGAAGVAGAGAGAGGPPQSGRGAGERGRRGSRRCREASRADEVRAAVKADIARVLSLSAASAVPVDRPLAELGLDSLIAVELRNALGQRVGVTLPATLAFDHPTVDAITHWLLADILAVSEPGSSSRARCRTKAAPPPDSVAAAGMVWQSSLTAFEETRTLSGGRAARCYLRRTDAGRRGPPLLLLHGSRLQNHHYFAALAEHLGHHDLIVPSLPGRCGSGGPPLGTVSESARWVLDLLAEVNLPPVVAVGHSATPAAPSRWSSQRLLAEPPSPPRSDAFAVWW